MIAPKAFSLPMVGLWIVCALAVPMTALADAVETQGDRIAVELAPRLAYLPDPDSALTIDDVVRPELASDFQPFAGSRLNFGVIFGTYWIRFAVHNGSDRDVANFLVIERTTMDDVQLFTVDDGGTISQQIVRSDTHFYDRPVPARQPVFRINLGPDETATYYLRFQTNGATGTDVRLVDPELFRERESRRVVSMGIFFGMLLIMLAHYLVMYALFREVSFLFLAATVASMTCYIATYKGFAFQFIWPEAENLSQRFTLPWAGVMFSFGSLFTVRFLNARTHAPLLAKILYLQALLGFLVPVVNMLDDAWTDRLAYSIGIAMPIAVLLTAVRCLRSRQRAAWIFLSAWTVLMLAALVYALSGLDLIPDNFVTSNGSFLATPIMLLMLSLATWDKFKSKEEEYRDTLEQRVVERTRELAEALESVKTLEGFIPICGHCKKVRDDAGFWNQIEQYVSTRTDAQFSHGVCPDCYNEHYAEELGMAKIDTRSTQ